MHEIAVGMDKFLYYCLPEDIILGRMVLDIVNFLEIHPERLREHESALALEALIRTYPCKKKK